MELLNKLEANLEEITNTAAKQRIDLMIQSNQVNSLFKYQEESQKKLIGIQNIYFDVYIY